MDPLVRMRKAASEGAIDQKIFELVESRFKLAVSGIDRIEKASGIAYPVAYVEPSILLSGTAGSFGQAILYARTIPLVEDRQLRVVIQICAPLVAYGLKGTIHAILAHEFLHYLDLVHRISTMGIVSDEVSGNLFESAYADEGRLIAPRAVFDDRNILSHITKRFPEGFRDYRLEDKVTKLWLERGLPRTNIALDTNTLKLSAESLSQIRFDQELLEKMSKIVKRSQKIRSRRRY